MMPANQKPMTAATKKVLVTDFLDYRIYLDAIYHLAKTLAGNYSYLRYAEDLGFSHTNVIHLIIRGKRPLSIKAAEKIVNALGLVKNERSYFEKLVAYQNCRKADKRELLFKKLLAIKQQTISSHELKINLEFFSEWYHIAIYELTALHNFSADPYWIADHLSPRIRPEQARKSLVLLENLGLIIFNQALERFQQTKQRIATGDDIAALAIVRYHQRMIEIGREAITSIDSSERDISGITFAVSAAMIDQFKEEIRAFRTRLLDMADLCQNKEMVCQMNVQLFPLTRPARGDK